MSLTSWCEAGEPSLLSGSLTLMLCSIICFKRHPLSACTAELAMSGLCLGQIATDIYGFPVTFTNARSVHVQYKL